MTAVRGLRHLTPGCGRSAARKTLLRSAPNCSLHLRELSAACLLGGDLALRSGADIYRTLLGLLARYRCASVRRSV
jgi:hypothetical protein